MAPGFVAPKSRVGFSPLYLTSGTGISRVMLCNQLACLVKALEYFSSGLRLRRDLRGPPAHGPPASAPPGSIKALLPISTSPHCPGLVTSGGPALGVRGSTSLDADMIIDEVESDWLTQLRQNGAQTGAATRGVLLPLHLHHSSLCPAFLRQTLCVRDQSVHLLGFHYEVTAPSRDRQRAKSRSTSQPPRLSSSLPIALTVPPEKRHTCSAFSAECLPACCLRLSKTSRAELRLMAANARPYRCNYLGGHSYAPISAGTIRCHSDVT